MNFLENNRDRFISAEEISEHLKDCGQEVGLTTVYRFLNLLEKKDEVRVEIKNHTKYYQYVSPQHNNHLFLKCKNCGKSMDLDCKEFESVNNHIKEEHKFSLDSNTILYGTCDTCSK